MTDEQTYILLKQFRARLEAALEEAAERMPEGAEKERVQRHDNAICRRLICFDKAHLKEMEGDEYFALAPLRRLLDEWGEDVERLNHPIAVGNNA